MRRHHLNRATNDRLGGFVAARLARTTVLSLALGIPLGGAAAADQLVPPEVVTRTRPLEAAYRFDKPATGRGFLDIEWSDVDGRVVEQRHLPLDLAGASELTLPLDITRAVTMKNRIATHLSLDGVDQSGGAVHREDDEARSFVVEPSDNPWSDFQIIMWQPNSQVGYAALKRLGITAGMVESDHRAERRTYLSDELDPLLANDLRCYLENIATDFYSPYHRWSGNLPVNWKFLEVKKRYRENPLDPSALIREPSLTDRGWLQNVHDRLSRDVRALQPYRPLYYNLGDETGIADLSAFWDFDFSETSLTAMRDWLKERYGSLTALNREWASKFDRWEQVTPMTTREAMQRPDHNFSAWADFKEWMDVAFARAVTAGTEAIHQADPHAVAAIEGAQIPGWGGYDYSRLAASVDAMELYDFGDSVEIVRSFNPRLIMLLTSGDAGHSRSTAFGGRCCAESAGSSCGTKKTSLSTRAATSPNADARQRPISPSCEAGSGRCLSTAAGIPTRSACSTRPPACACNGCSTAELRERTGAAATRAPNIRMMRSERVLGTSLA